MKQPTAPLPLAAPPAAAQASGCLMRGLFALLFGGLFVAGATVFGLVAYTLMNLSAAREAPVTQGEGAVAAEPLAAQTLVTPAAEAGEDEPNVWDKHGPVDILLLGLDVDDCAYAEGGEVASTTRTDTLILVRYDPASGRVGMLSIPRDLYVYINDQIGARKINTAHVYGTVYEDGEPVPESGPRLTMEVIEANLELPVHRYVRVDFQGFKKIVDALGGIEIDVPASSEDPSVGLVDYNFPDGHCGTMTIRFDPGPQTMDGERALQYARSRYSTDDFDRSRRQMQVLEAIRAKGTRLGVILDLPQLIPAVNETVDTDLTPDEILSLARMARGVDTDDIVMYQIDHEIVSSEMLLIGDVPQAILRLRQDAYDGLRRRYLAVEPPPTPTAPPTQAVPPASLP